MSILNTKWKCSDLKQTHLCYKTGKVEISSWSLEIHFYSEVNNTLIGKLTFNKKGDNKLNGHEFVSFIYIKKLDKIIGSDSNGYYEGYLNKNELNLHHLAFEHIKFPQNITTINSFSNKFYKI